MMPSQVQADSRPTPGQTAADLTGHTMKPTTGCWRGGTDTDKSTVDNASTPGCVQSTSVLLRGEPMVKV